MSSIHIEVSGEADSGKTLISNVINKALTKSGFTNVTLVDETNIPVAAYEPETVLDLVQQSRPDLFATPITISEATMVNEEVGEPDLAAEIGQSQDDFELAQA